MFEVFLKAYISKLEPKLFKSQHQPSYLNAPQKQQCRLHGKVFSQKRALPQTPVAARLLCVWLPICKAEPCTSALQLVITRTAAAEAVWAKSSKPLSYARYVEGPSRRYTAFLLKTQSQTLVSLGPMYSKRRTTSLLIL